MKSFDDFIKDTNNKEPYQPKPYYSFLVDDEKELSKKEKELDIKLKEKYGNQILNILIYYCLFIALIVAVHMVKSSPNLSDEVLITLLTTTTANILILPYIILKYLFHKK